MASPTMEREAADQPGKGAGGGGARQLVEAAVCLVLAVIVFRTFEVEGYMISTGSMAPSLWGYHKRVVCPTCRYSFAMGIAFDDDDAAGDVRGVADGDATLPAEPCVCPNCGQESIDVADVPRSQGDQLLVHKNAYKFHPPRRWETVVFRNPHRPTQAYVKRVVGLPGERLRIVAGDVWIDGEPARKGHQMQRALRVPVHEHAFAPQDAHWQSRWRAEGDRPTWKESSRGFEIDLLDDPAALSRTDDGDSRPPVAWVVYRHWIRAGGSHETSVPIGAWPEDGNPPLTSFLPVRYDPDSAVLSCTGALPDSWRRRLLNDGSQPEFQRQIERLHEESHYAPVTDVYGYNRREGESAPVAVRDLMFSAAVEVTGGEGRFGVRMTDGVQRFDLVLDVGAEQAHLWVDDDERPARSVPFSRDTLMAPVLVEMSLFDRQVLVAVGDESLFEPLTLAPLPTDSEPPRAPVKFGARGLSARVTELKMFRDVHYRTDTPRTARHGIEEECVLGPDEYFVLGDNSPVSADSRCWPSPAVHARLFLGKPFLVHLPSRPGRVRIGNRTAHIRVPEVSRIRYIR
ncbi:MAG: signal peptidase I [Planctomycetaceae bacterium]